MNKLNIDKCPDCGLFTSDLNNHHCPAKNTVLCRCGYLQEKHNYCPNCGRRWELKYYFKSYRVRLADYNRSGQIFFRFEDELRNPKELSQHFYFGSSPGEIVHRLNEFADKIHQKFKPL